MSEAPPRYLAYMLRIWQANSDGRRIWRASLESPHTGERQGFADLKSLFAFLDERTTQGAAVAEETGGSVAPQDDDSSAGDAAPHMPPPAAASLPAT